MKLATNSSKLTTPYKPSLNQADTNLKQNYICGTHCVHFLSDINTKLDNHVVITFFLIIFGY